MEELISVIVPIYNGEKFISRCVDSVFGQTYKNFELILVDDGSNDGTLDVIKEYENNFAQVKVIHTENSGVSNARNLGMSAARGEYITFLDADDRLCLDALELMYALCIDYSADIVVADLISVQASEEPQDLVRDGKTEVWEKEKVLQKSVDDDPVSYSACGKLYRKEVIEDIRFAEGRKVHEDSFFIFQCFAKSQRVAYKNATVYLYTVTSGSASRASFSDKFFDILYFADRKTEIISESYPIFKDKIPDIRVRANISLLYNLCKTYEKKYRKAEKECIRNIRKITKSSTFIPKNKFEQRFIFIVKCRLFWLYKLYLYLRMRKYI